MKRALLLLALSALLPGCASHSALTLPPVGPRATRLADQRRGGLMVYSEFEHRMDSNPSSWLQHSDYSILNQKAEVLAKVRNSRGGPDSTPVVVKLDPGSYVVRAQTQGYGWISVPVLVERGRITRLYLDDSTRPDPEAPETVVRLPDGRPIGWAAVQSGK